MNDVFGLDPLMYSAYTPSRSRTEGPSMCVLVGIAAVSVLFMAYAQQQCHSYYPRLRATGQGIVSMVAQSIQGKSETAAAVPSATVVDNTETKEANEAKVKEIIKSTPNLVVIIFAPWCGHCAKMIPQLEGLHSKYPKTNLLLINGDALDSKNWTGPDAIFSLTAYPTACKVVQGHLEEVSGGPEAAMAAVESETTGDAAPAEEEETSGPALMSMFANVMHPHKRPMDKVVEFDGEVAGSHEDHLATQDMLNDFF